MTMNKAHKNISLKIKHKKSRNPIRKLCEKTTRHLNERTMKSTCGNQYQTVQYGLRKNWRKPNFLKIKCTKVRKNKTGQEVHMKSTFANSIKTFSKQMVSNSRKEIAKG